MCNKSQGYYGLDSVLSPAAQAVMDAWENEWSKGSFCHEERSVAAALRAAADRVYHHWDGADCVDYLCSIAAELEGSND
jgi:hypothetical protein